MAIAFVIFVVLSWIGMTAWHRYNIRRMASIYSLEEIDGYIKDIIQLQLPRGDEMINTFLEVKEYKLKHLDK